ncbi:uncharacterized protein M421DRAFT_354385 [Didymella exigua CBS 183.55]|uniref:Uncharacterized protein n=1 Tax=Didymella exigua CBS 183.55 TaxID=1150837 RepID=A0A6A5R390_9PLEO|nr:uncharacterized protein M421DRAFT_354385 [Didymella exigua CBS 183.55]KAF1922521.1 hypothetical protein M421DRAFT_354385 [Didymella exigua CBS 183.55]
MALFSSCCGSSDDDDDTQPPRDSRDRIVVARGETPDFRAVHYKDAEAGPEPNADAASDRSSQLSPRATPPRRSQTPTRDSPSAPGNPQVASPFNYSQPSQPRTPPSVSTARRVGQKDEGMKAVGAASASGPSQQTADGEVSMADIRKFMGDEVQKM